MRATATSGAFGPLRRLRGMFGDPLQPVGERVGIARRHIARGIIGQNLLEGREIGGDNRAPHRRVLEELERGRARLRHGVGDDEGIGGGEILRHPARPAAAARSVTRRTRPSAATWRATASRSASRPPTRRSCAFGRRRTSGAECLDEQVNAVIGEGEAGVGDDECVGAMPSAARAAARSRGK